MAEGIIILVIALTAAWAIYHLIHKAKHGGGCCGEHEAAEKRIQIVDKNKSHYPYAATLTVEGMTCENCARRVENALNHIDGTWAKVDIGSHLARIRLKTAPDEAALTQAVIDAGYAVSKFTQT